MAEYTIAGVQMDVAFADKEKNLARIEGFLAEVAARGASLAIFPECALTGYCFESLEEAAEHAEPVPGPSTLRLAQTCMRTSAFAVVGMLESEGTKVYNAAVLIGPSGVVGAYRKTHLPFLGVDRFATPGERPFEAIDAGGIRVGLNICYDSAFPEPARILALEGVDLIALPTNWPPSAECVAEHVINARAIENNIYYAAVNRVGAERGFRFIGHSKIAAPSGETLAYAAHDKEEILFARIDTERARRKKLVRVPGKHEIDRIADRRPDLYGRLVEPGPAR